MATPTSHTPAHESTVTVAPFRAWRGSQCIIAEGPIEVTIKATGIVAEWDVRFKMDGQINYAAMG